MSKSGRPGCPEFMQLLRQHRHRDGQVFTVGLLAREIGSGRSHVSQVLRNLPGDKGQRYGEGRGGRTRGKLVSFFRRQFPEATAAMLAALGWDERGQIVPRGESHVEHQEA